MTDPTLLLSLHCLSKQFADGAMPVVNGLSFDVREGELFALLGPSGGGKTTVLRLIAGLERADSGTITLAGRRLTDEGLHVPPERRGVGLVFQDYALFPHLTVAQNVAFGLRAWKRAEREARVAEVLKLVGLQGLERRLPHALSGGQQQRVALARALAPRPRLLLLDEPFSNLDALFRQEMRQQVRDLLKKEGTTALLVTHDQEEALLFADRVAVMQAGRIEQVGTPEEIYATPRTLFVAQFLGQTNLVLTQAHGTEAETPIGRLTLHRPAEGTVLVALRPEHLALEATPGHPNAQPGIILSRAYRGHDITYRVQLGAVDCLVHTSNREAFAVGDTVYVHALAPAVVLDKAGA
ncbi:MAG TPA: ABC transporter ATP-binding protein [Rubricoccaceae bacterium]|nr:ABC transporter ATP-binding protein [Rubricoccaceae bacterium]